MLREIHKHTDTQPPVLSHPHITKQTQHGLTLSRRPPTQNRTLTHTSYTPRHTWPCPRDGHAVWRNTASDKSEVYIHMQAHTQTHADSFRTGASIHGNPQIQPCQVGTDTSSQPRYPPYTHTHISSTKRAAEAFAHRSRAHRHTPQRHSYRHQPYTHKHTGKMGEGSEWRETDTDMDRQESKRVKLTLSPPPSTSTPLPR